MCVGRISPHHIRNRASDLWPNSFDGSVLRDFIPRHVKTHRVTASEMCSNTFDASIRNDPCVLEDDKPMLRLVKRTRTQVVVDPQSSSNNVIDMCYRIQVQKQSRCSENAERLPCRIDNEKEKNCYNLEERLAGKRKRCDLNLNLDNNLECSWPLFAHEEDSDDMSESNSGSDSDSDSDAYSGPSLS